MFSNFTALSRSSSAIALFCLPFDSYLEIIKYIKYIASSYSNFYNTGERAVDEQFLVVELSAHADP